MSCDNDHNWEQSAKVKGIVKLSIGPYSEIIKEIKRKSQQSTVSACFLQKKGKILNHILHREVKSVHYTTVKINQYNGLTVVCTKTFSLGFEDIKLNVQFFFCFIRCSFVILCYI